MSWPWNRISWPWQSRPWEAPRASFEEQFTLHPLHPKQIAPVDQPPKAEPLTSSRCIQIATWTVFLVVTGFLAIVFCREYLGGILYWFAHERGFHGPFLFSLLFIAVSFPVTWGYVVLNIGAGYLYGLFMGVLVTAFGACIGATVAFCVCRRVMKAYVSNLLGQYENFKQIVRVIEGRQGFKIIMMTRITPVPFGLQNALFSAGNITLRRYVLATVVGLLPTQLLNAYMGTTLRNMEDVLAGGSSNTFVLVCQVLIAVAVTFFVNQRMKREVQVACEREAALARSAVQSNPDDTTQISIPDDMQTTIHVSPSAFSLSTISTDGESESRLREPSTSLGSLGSTSSTTTPTMGDGPRGSSDPMLNVREANRHRRSLSAGSQAAARGGDGSSRTSSRGPLAE